MAGYSFAKYEKEHMARAMGLSLPVSFKQGTEICRFIKHKPSARARKLLEMVINKEAAVPYNRYNWDLGHKTKIGPGRYPQKASKEFIKVIEAAEANAQYKGLNTSNLVIVHAAVQKAGKTWHYGRQSRRQMKRASIEIVLEEKSPKQDNKSEKTTKVKKEQVKKE